jgi:hypothetical protein
MRRVPSNQRFSLRLAADEPYSCHCPSRHCEEQQRRGVVIAPVVIARSDSDVAILFSPLLRIASSLPPLAMTAGAMAAGGNDSGGNDNGGLRWRAIGIVPSV